MSEKSDRPSIDTLSSHGEIAVHINKAFRSSDIVAICQAIGDAIRLHNISNISKKAGIGRSSIYRAFGGRQSPNLSTVLSVLDAMGFQLKVAQRRGERARLARARNPESVGQCSAKSTSWLRIEGGQLLWDFVRSAIERTVQTRALDLLIIELSHRRCHHERVERRRWKLAIVIVRRLMSM
jgi:probable addiction module antidote protein